MATWAALGESTNMPQMGYQVSDGQRLGQLARLNRLNKPPDRRVVSDLNVTGHVYSLSGCLSGCFSGIGGPA